MSSAVGEPWPPADWTDWPEQEEGGTVVGSGRPPASAPPAGSTVASGENTVDRLAEAKLLLRRLEERSARPAAAPGEDGRVLSVAAPLRPLLPAGGLRRGSTVSVAGGPGSLSLLFGLLAEASAEGAWAGVVGVPGLGAVAAAEAGVRLERLALVPRPGADLVAVAAALLDGLDVVVLGGTERAGLRPGDRQRLAARARQRGAVLLALGPWPGADLALGCTGVRWRGLEGGAGRLRSRRALVRCTGRGTGAAGRETALLLPGERGAMESAPRESAAGETAPEQRDPVPASGASVGSASGGSAPVGSAPGPVAPEPLGSAPVGSESVGSEPVLARAAVS